jgi:hypothetical protein
MANIAVVRKAADRRPSFLPDFRRNSLAIFKREVFGGYE